PPSPNANSYLGAELVRCTLRVRHPGTSLLARTGWGAARGRGAGAGAAARCGCARGVRERTGPPPRPSSRTSRANSYRRARLVPCTVRARPPGTSWPTRRGRLREVCRGGGLAGLAELGERERGGRGLGGARRRGDRDVEGVAARRAHPEQRDAVLLGQGGEAVDRLGRHRDEDPAAGLAEQGGRGVDAVAQAQLGERDARA